MEFPKKSSWKALLLLAALVFTKACSQGSDCPLPAPFCGGSFPLNTQYTTQYGPPWANVVTSSADWAYCFGPYALCYYAECVPSPGSNGTVADCPCFQTFGLNFVDINAILNEDVYEETVSFCNANPGLCQQPNQAPVCQSLISGEFMEGADLFSTFGFYRAKQEPIGLTDCSDDPGFYAGCMTGPCFDPVTPGLDGTEIIECQCPIWNGPFQVGQTGLSCDASPMLYSAAYNPNPAPSPTTPCQTGSCIPDAPPDTCGCGLYVPGTTTLPPNSGVDCTEVCQEYNTCFRQNSELQVGYSCDATICTSDDTTLIADACVGLQDCDLSEIFKAESAAQCSCCASQLCGCTPNAVTDQKINTLNTEQRNQGETPQCDINGTLCGS